MKKSLAMVIAVVLLFAFHTLTAITATAAPALPFAALSSLEHNCPNTGRMVPETFSPFVTNYLLTVASWVSRVEFTPVSVDPMATIMVNGQYLVSGQTSQEIEMTNDPQMVTIAVTSSTDETMVYTVFLQRRPSEARTRVSVGYLKDFYQNSGKWYRQRRYKYVI